MAEFSEVMRQWGRLCTQHCAENADDCDGCLLGGTRADVCGSYARDNTEDVEELERLVMSWAAEHPEPVYPTWGEWFVEIGAAKRVPIGDPWPVEMADGSMFGPEYEIVLAQNERIPADIAQKLGIEPLPKA